MGVSSVPTIETSPLTSNMKYSLLGSALYSVKPVIMVPMFVDSYEAPNLSCCSLSDRLRIHDRFEGEVSSMSSFSTTTCIVTFGTFCSREPKSLVSCIEQTNINITDIIKIIFCSYFSTSSFHPNLLMGCS